MNDQSPLYTPSNEFSKREACVSSSPCPNCVFLGTCEKLSLLNDSINTNKVQIKGMVEKIDGHLDWLFDKLESSNGKFLKSIDKSYSID